MTIGEIENKSLDLPTSTPNQTLRFLVSGLSILAFAQLSLSMYDSSEDCLHMLKFLTRTSFTVPVSSDTFLRFRRYSIIFLRNALTSRIGFDFIQFFSSAISSSSSCSAINAKYSSFSTSSSKSFSIYEYSIVCIGTFKSSPAVEIIKINGLSS